ncbi:MAG: radical SAM protein [Clostridiales bacterium]|nr:radical SAM protein [Clostridiales bacterium]
MEERKKTWLGNQVQACELCPRKCRINRLQTRGFCGAPAGIVAARAALHAWEEPCISGIRGSGAIFFNGCTLRCRFCQNQRISRDFLGMALDPETLADTILRLQEQGAHNINLVTATHFLPWILPALDTVRNQLHIPVVYNCGGYERVETVEMLRDDINIWLPDLKYFDPALSNHFSAASDYFEIASAAIRQMIRQTGALQFHEEKEANGQTHLVLDRGVIVRHLVLPGHKEDSIQLLHWMADSLPRGSFLISLMSQYTPYATDDDYPELNRRITSYEYQKVVDAALELGLNQGYMQKKSSAREEYTPSFHLEGLIRPDT